jgi:16S rRNA (guanine966-N2)-methyltransferase
MPRADSRPGRLRIVGGSLRGSKIEVAQSPGLRPTPDCVRETLFNWLMPVIDGARCLDLFAGTGALGIEALSRGAASVDFVETDRNLAAHLRADLERLKQTAQVHHADALRFLAQGDARYDIAFIDPPFSAGLWSAAAEALQASGRLADDAWIYVESPQGENLALPAGWMPHRESRAGAVHFALYRTSKPSAKL